MTTRRNLLLALSAGAALLAIPALAQPQSRMRRIGFFGGGSLQSSASWLAAFRQGMGELNWNEGRDYVLNARYANGLAQTMPSLAAELVATQPDLLLTVAEEAVGQLARQTQTIPIVFAVAADPVANGVATSLRRPGGNATGLTGLGLELGAKRLQLLKEAFPKITHVGFLFEPANVSSRAQVTEIQDAARRLKIRISPLELRVAADIEAAFERGAALGAHAYIVNRGGILNTQRQAIADRSLRSRVPVIVRSTEYVEAGGLMSYAPSYDDNFRRAAAYVDKILKGAKPGDLPIEQPTKFELVINLKTAKAMGLVIPRSILLRADRVIE